MTDYDKYDEILDKMKRDESGQKPAKSKKKKTRQPGGLMSKIKRVFLSLVAIGVTGGSAPYFVGALDTHTEQKDVEQSLETMITSRASVCPVSVATTLTESDRQRLSDTANSTYADQYQSWQDVTARYEDGLRILSELLTPEDRKTKSELSETAKLLKGLSDIGVSICLDETLETHDLGSAYDPSQGVITLNPQLVRERLVIHLRRHLENLRGPLLTNYQGLIAAETESPQNDFTRFARMNSFLDDMTSGDLIALGKVGDPNTDDFTTIEAPSAEQTAENGYRVILQTTPKQGG